MQTKGSSVKKPKKEKVKKESAKDYRRRVGFDAYYAEVIEQFDENEPDFISKIKNRIDRVMIILVAVPEARDSYKVLMAEYLAKYFPLDYKRFDSTKAWLLDPDFPEYNTILRSRTLLQEDFEELRGKHYGSRKDMAESIRTNWYTDGARTI